jgi:hypothetical protein
MLEMIFALVSADVPEAKSLRIQRKSAIVQRDIKRSSASVETEIALNGSAAHLTGFNIVVRMGLIRPFCQV